MSTTTCDIEQQLTTLVETYRVKIIDEYKNLAVKVYASVLENNPEQSKDKIWDQVISRINYTAVETLIRKKSNWSGGHSITNMLEQVESEVAAEYTKDYIFGHYLSQSDTIEMAKKLK